MEYKINNDLFFLILEDNKNYVIDFPALNTKIKVLEYSQTHQQIYNPLSNPSLQNYFENTWWNSVLFWSDVITCNKNSHTKNYSNS